ncbi:hypothetical protein CKO51_00270 [Rhodopirellula sp. SM50]|nr:hypothetical protein [Rhodopirellula sp. SM50]PAY21539.1 hypothetical protein CKO51_00270 [Rhodopirellula sp. SM50]
MTTEQGHSIEGQVGKTRLPFRLAAALLGVIFIAVAFFQMLDGAENWIHFASAIIMALLGVQFLYSAWTEQWKSPFEWFSDGGIRQINQRFLMVEPVSCGTATLEASRQSRLPNQDVNPYAPPSDSTAASIADQVQAMSSQGTALHQLTEQFMAGYPFIHYGVVFFLDPDDEAVIHAALPLASATDQLVRRNADEAIRVLGEFLANLPDAGAVVRGRNLVVRMISSYDRLDDEVASPIVVPWSSISGRNVEA